MSLNPQPKRLADEVQKRLAFTLHTKVDEYTLKRFQFSLERLREDGRMEPQDYIALGLVYFNLKAYNNFLRVMDEALDRHQDLDVHANAIIGKMMISDNQLATIPQFDFYAEWFDTKRNPQKEPLSFQFAHTHWPYKGERYAFRKEVIGNVMFGSDGVCRIEAGPLLVMEGYDHFKKEKCDFFNHICELFLERVVLGMATADELLYFQDILNKEDFYAIIGKAKESMKKKNVVISDIPGLMHRLKKDIPVTITIKGGHIFASNADLDIFLSGATVDEALAEFKEFFSEDSRYWIEALPVDLSDDALALKSRYLEYVET